MSVTKQKPAIEIEERTHYVGIHTPRGGTPRIEILREEIESGKAKNLGVKKNISWADLAQTQQFQDFKDSLGIESSEAFFNSLKTLFDDLCEE